MPIVILILFAFTVSIATAIPASAQDQDKDRDDILSRLMGEPVTLLDWGLAQIDRDIERAARRTAPRRVGIGAAPPVTGTIYNWRERRVTAYVSITAPRPQRTAQACRGLFADVVATLTEGAPSGPNAAGWYLRSAFRPKAHFWVDRFEDVGAKLLNLVRLEISFIPAEYEAMGGDNRRVRCSGRLDAAGENIRVDVIS